MRVGVPKEIKTAEARVGITPPGVEAFVNNGHEVYIEKEAGLGSGITDEEYIKAGAKIVNTSKEIYETADLILKVKEPQPNEYDYLREGQVLFAYLHLAPDKQQTQALLDRKVIGIAYETVQLDNGSLPLLTPMSEIAGRMAVTIGAYLLTNMNKGRGIVLGGVPGVEPAEVVIIGGGTVGINAARTAIGMGARVTVIDIDPRRLAYLDDIFNGRATTLMSNNYNIAQSAQRADLLIGAVLIPGARTPKLVTKDIVKTMKNGSVIVDVAIDQGGCVETCNITTSHNNPYFIRYGVVHYSVPNIPGAVPRTSTFALTNVTLPYALQIANKGYKNALLENQALLKGLNVYKGMLTYKPVAEAQGLHYIDPIQALNNA
ncbi:MAG: alanine dehydrogenase [Clostridiales bacterium]|jgi:alanine dehydrogenase|nr:alanine dehydrogenase [Clostridiales bacterium]